LVAPSYVVGMIDSRAIRLRWDADHSKRDERGKRVFAASEARAAGWGGVAAVAGITGLARSRIIRGLKDLDGPALERGRIRRAGGGRHRVTATDGTLLGELKRLVEPATMGDPMRPLTWVSKSREKLACELNASGHAVSPNTVGRLLVDELEYSRQVNRKTLEGASHPDRNAQFEHINAQVIAAQSAGQPVISVDTKKKELIGNLKNGGTDYRPKGDPLDVNVHDFKDEELGKVAPHGVYDPTTNAGWVSVGITHDTAEVAVQSIRTWLDRIGWSRAAVPALRWRVRSTPMTDKACPGAPSRGSQPAYLSNRSPRKRNRSGGPASKFRILKNHRAETCRGIRGLQRESSEILRQRPGSWPLTSGNVGTSANTRNPRGETPLAGWA
jgi:hypothetical protein